MAIMILCRRSSTSSRVQVRRMLFCDISRPEVATPPALAANAGGVATSGLEMSQNSVRLTWTREEVDDRLHKIMIAIHKNCYETAEMYGTPGNLVNGANIGGFLKVANAMLDQGLV